MTVSQYSTGSDGPRQNPYQTLSLCHSELVPVQPGTSKREMPVPHSAPSVPTARCGLAYRYWDCTNPWATRMYRYTGISVHMSHSLSMHILGTVPNRRSRHSCTGTGTQLPSSVMRVLAGSLQVQAHHTF